MADNLTVRHLDEDRFTIEIRGHVITVDQPVDVGGADTAPTPTELFIAGLASCVAFYARRYLARHQLNTEGLSVSADFDTGSRPTRVTRIRVLLTPPHDLPAERNDAFLAVASHCTIHNTLAGPTPVDIILTESSPVTA